MGFLTCDTYIYISRLEIHISWSSIRPAIGKIWRWLLVCQSVNFSQYKTEYHTSQANNINQNSLLVTCRLFKSLGFMLFAIYQYLWDAWRDWKLLKAVNCFQFYMKFHRLLYSCICAVNGWLSNYRVTHFMLKLLTCFSCHRR